MERRVRRKQAACSGVGSSAGSNGFCSARGVRVLSSASVGQTATQ